MFSESNIRGPSRGNILPLKVVAFDSWVGGVKNFERLHNSFRNNKMEIVLVHLSSWGNDTSRPKSEKIGNILVRDISYYNNGDFRQVLAVERPDAVIFLSIHTFAHRGFNRYCQFYKIPTVNLFHGIISVFHVDGKAPFQVNVLSQVRRILGRVFKLTRHVFPTYIASLIVTKAPLSDWKRFAYDIVVGAIGSYPMSFASDATTDRCCVYVDSDKKYASKQYRLPNNHVVAVGNVDLIKFGISKKILGSQAVKGAFKHTDVVYIDTGFVYTGWVYSSETDFITHILETKYLVERSKKHFVFKPHPQHRKSLNGTVLPSLLAAGVTICEDDYFLEQLKKTCCVICEPSSVVLVPALLGLPILLAQYGRLRYQQYGEGITSYPMAFDLKDLEDIDKLLLLSNSVREYRSKEILSWINDNAGPMPPEDMPNRVASVIFDMIKSRECLLT